MKLPEFAPYEGLTFEIQVRTVLQHAWAEIEHDRSYKFSGVLPTPIQRRLNLLAGVLEIVDREFVVLANEIDRYADEVAQKTRAGNLDVEINSTSIQQYLMLKIHELKTIKIELTKDVDLFEVSILELRDFGIQTLEELDSLVARVRPLQRWTPSDRRNDGHLSDYQGQLDRPASVRGDEEVRF